MKLAALASRDAFALLGPGFGGGGWVLLSGLGEASGPPDLVYAPFETPGNAPRRFVAGRREVVTVELEPPLVAPRVVLRAEGYHEAVARIREAIAKDRAELAMITDLLRNDLTPVCRPQTVRVTCDRRTLVLPYALQTVSDIAGELHDGATPLDALAALHPGGSVTGAPKAAALAMIRDLEAGPRGAYCGALGLCAGERSVFSLLIRTASRTGEEWVYGVGSGVVWDSDADAELAELHLKLGALWSDTPSS